MEQKSGRLADATHFELGDVICHEVEILTAFSSSKNVRGKVEINGM